MSLPGTDVLSTALLQGQLSLPLSLLPQSCLDTKQLCFWADHGGMCVYLPPGPLARPVHTWADHLLGDRAVLLPQAQATSLSWPRSPGGSLRASQQVLISPCPCLLSAHQGDGCVMGPYSPTGHTEHMGHTGSMRHMVHIGPWDTWATPLLQNSVQDSLPREGH